MNFLERIRSEHELFFKNEQEYKKLVDSVSELFRFSGNDQLKTDYLPAAFTGQYQKKNPIVIFGLNPGFDEKLNPREKKESGKTWEDYLKLRNNLYLLFKELNHPSPYCKSFFKLFSNLYDTQDEMWDFFHDNVVNLNLISYHSKSTGISVNTKEQIEYLKESYFSQLEFAQTMKPRLYVFNGSSWHKLLIKNNIITDFEKEIIIPKSNIYFFKISNTPAILFDTFFQSHYAGMTDQHRTETIPKLIKERYSI